jgi:hypothetical protein
VAHRKSDGKINEKPSDPRFTHKPGPANHFLKDPHADAVQKYVEKMYSLLTLYTNNSLCLDISQSLR